MQFHSNVARILRGDYGPIFAQHWFSQHSLADKPLQPQEVLSWTTEGSLRTTHYYYLSRLGMVAAVILTASGCATTKDLNILRAQMSDQVAAVRNDVVQSLQDVEGLKTDITSPKSLGMAPDQIKGRFDGLQTTLQSLQTEAESYRVTLKNLRGDFNGFKAAQEGLVLETNRLRRSVGSIEQGMLHQLQFEVTLARGRIKQLEHVIDSLQKPVPPGKEGVHPSKS